MFLSIAALHGTLGGNHRIEHVALIVAKVGNKLLNLAVSEALSIVDYLK